MDDLERQLHDYAGQLDEVDGSSRCVRRRSWNEPRSDGPGATGRSSCRCGPARRGDPGWGGHRPHVGRLGDRRAGVASRDDLLTTPPAPLRARIELPSDRLVAGEQMQGEVIVDNDTGSPIDVAGCSSIYQAGLARDGYRQEMAWTTCLRAFEVPVGESRWPIGVLARVHGCTNDETEVTYPRCLPSGSCRSSRRGPTRCSSWGSTRFSRSRIRSRSRSSIPDACGTDRVQAAG